jgi:hypothetical protein
MTDSTSKPELVRLARLIGLLSDIRYAFVCMEDDGERQRAWAYLQSRFPEYEKAEEPHWEGVTT